MLRNGYETGYIKRKQKIKSEMRRKLGNIFRSRIFDDGIAIRLSAFPG
jgi:hypothetical protein